jgi:hypothetical protein
MKLTIEENSIDIKELKAKLEAKFPNYKMASPYSYMLYAAKSKTIGCSVLIRKKSLIINGCFPSMKATLIFNLCFVLLGILIPLIIYFVSFHGKMKAVEKEVGEFIKQEYRLV